MANVIKFKRGLNANFSSVALVAGEPAFVTDTGKLYVGDGTNKILINPTYGTAANANTGTAAGNVPVLDSNGLLNTSVLPALAITETFVVASDAAMTALTAQIGDVAIRTDLNETFILSASPASTLANWKQMLTPTSPVTSVAGKTGAVTLVSSDVGLGNVTNESKATMFTNPTFTGSASAPTPATADNSTLIATTAYVKAQEYLTNADLANISIDGGTF